MISFELRAPRFARPELRQRLGAHVPDRRRKPLRARSAHGQHLMGATEVRKEDLRQIVVTAGRTVGRCKIRGEEMHA